MPAPEPREGDAGPAQRGSFASPRRSRPRSRGTCDAPVGSGARGEKIRTYNFKENRVTDHRIGLTLYKLDAVMAGQLDELVDALIADKRARQLAESRGG